MSASTTKIGARPGNASRQIPIGRNHSPDIPDMRRRIRAYPWASTPLGAIETWSPSLITAVDLCLGSRMCGCVYWGSERVVLYNDAYASILGTKHPWALGRSATEVWPEIIDVIGPLMDATLATGETTGGDDVAIFLNRSGYVEEFYCSFSYSPIVNSDGAIEGVFAILPETSQRVIGERRLRTLQKLGVEIRESTHPRETLTIAARVFEENARDIPFSALYLWREDDACAELMATANITPGTELSPDRIELDGAGPMSVALACAGANGHVVIPLTPERAPVPLGAWSVPATEMLALPFVTYDESAPNGLMLAGINPHKAFDPEYMDFYRLVADQLTRSLASAFLHEQEEERVQELQERARAAHTAERLRIARDLHDTLLQSIQGLRFLLEAAIERARTGDESAASLFDNALDAADHAISEGREVLSLLRSTDNRGDSIGELLRRLCTDIGAGSSIEFDIMVQGREREFSNSVWYEVFGFCREAITNAVRHSGANNVSVTLAFEDPVRISIDDDGCGISAAYISEGRAGHYGLTGMRERAETIGGDLELETVRGRGTSISLTIPASNAYESAGTSGMRA